jgi:hypothetical protein
MEAAEFMSRTTSEADISTKQIVEEKLLLCSFGCAMGMYAFQERNFSPICISGMQSSEHRLDDENPKFSLLPR